LCDDADWAIKISMPSPGSSKRSAKSWKCFIPLDWRPVKVFTRQVIYCGDGVGSSTLVVMVTTSLSCIPLRSTKPVTRIGTGGVGSCAVARGPLLTNCLSFCDLGLKKSPQL